MKDKKDYNFINTSIKLEKEDYKKFKDITKIKGLKISYVLKDFIIKYIKHNEYLLKELPTTKNYRHNTEN